MSLEPEEVFPAELARPVPDTVEEEVAVIMMEASSENY